MKVTMMMMTLLSSKYLSSENENDLQTTGNALSFDDEILFPERR